MHLVTTQSLTCAFSLICRGKATPENSGFDGEGGWDGSAHVLDNHYYSKLLDYSQFVLEYEDNTNFAPFPNQYYWEQEVAEGGPAGTFMLHADMAIAFDMEGYVDPDNGQVNCTMVSSSKNGQDPCPVSPLLSYAQAYAEDNDQWMLDFRNAYLKMVGIGCRDGACHEL